MHSFMFGMVTHLYSKFNGHVFGDTMYTGNWLRSFYIDVTTLAGFNRIVTFAELSAFGLSFNLTHLYEVALNATPENSSSTPRVGRITLNGCNRWLLGKTSTKKNQLNSLKSPSYSQKESFSSAHSLGKVGRKYCVVHIHSISSNGLMYYRSYNARCLISIGNSTAQTWWRHQMETFTALLAIWSGNSPVPGEFLAQRPVTRSFDLK